MEPIRIPLRRQDGSVHSFALVDPEDADLAQLRWHGHKYARRSIGRYPTAWIWLHKEVAKRLFGEIPAGAQVDHKNLDKLDCRRNNLRIATNQQNKQNLGPRSDGSSGYRGVSFYKPGNKWRAYATILGKRKHLGYFDTAEEAANVASAFRSKHMPFSVETP